MDVREYKAVYVNAENAVLDGEQVLHVTKAKEKEWDFDENTYAKLIGSDFHNGTIEVKMLARLLPDAPELARGFIGIAFRINEDDSEFESFYARPTNGPRMTDDPVRLSHGTQYFSYPTYTFAWFREHGITKYDSKADIALNEWITLKAEISGAEGKFYINDLENPVNTVEMIHGADARGAVGLFVDIGTDAYFRDLKITCTD